MSKRHKPSQPIRAQRILPSGHTLFTRPTHPSDVEAFSKLELQRYAQNYKEQPRSSTAIAKMFHQRLTNASRWMWTLEIDGKPEGFITGQPTSSHPEDFVSWEESTNYGTLDGTYDENGENVYVVNLDVSRRGTKLGGQYLLMACLGAQAIRCGKSTAVFESRMPQFREWVGDYAAEHKLKVSKLSEEKLDALAYQYSQTKISIDGHDVMYDRLLRFYEKTGFTFVRTIRNAFNDPESLNYGVICIGYNPIPKKLRFGLSNVVMSIIFKSFVRNPTLFRLVIGKKSPQLPKPALRSLKRHHKYFIWGVVGLSILPIVLSPLSGLQSRLANTLPWVGVGTLASELIFVIGLAIIASDIGIKLGRNPLKWRAHLVSAVRKSSHERVFWIGFIINTIGAIATAVIVAAGIFFTLPFSSWGLLIVPLIDFGITLSIRAAALQWIREKSSQSVPSQA